MSAQELASEAPFPDRRRGVDRRLRSPLLSELRWAASGRRRTLRRAEDQVDVHLDWHAPHLLLVTLLVFVLSATDAALTLILLQAGLVEEANPVMRHFIALDVRLFVAVKSALTGFGLVALVAYSNLLMFNQLRLARMLYYLLLFYAGLIAYEVFLLVAHG